MCLELAEKTENRLLFVTGESFQKLDDPLLMLDGHFTEALESGLSELHGYSTTITGIQRSNHPPFSLELIGDARNIPSGNHQALRDLIHVQAVWVALQLRHQIKARQGSLKILPYPPANMVLDAHVAGQQAKPQAQRLMVILGRTRFEVDY